ncbi:unnamed protein product [Paramecium pentaurelia]|uniref:Uncharacterized protein n=1 Tax=Paramecium pentaurelia TaxID=43138 RepID=A0A8S1Y0D6_9CILI|nr:unnamed protein product [Paramecium pentaurelia]
MKLTQNNNNQIEDKQNNQENKEYIELLQNCVHYLLLQLEKSDIEVQFQPEFLENIFDFDFGNVNNKAHHISQLTKAINNLQYQQNLKQQNQIKYCQEKITILQQHINHANNINTELMMQLSITNEKNVKLVRELSEKQNKIQEITIQQQIVNMDENSMRIEIDVPQFKENIQNLIWNENKLLNK